MTAPVARGPVMLGVEGFALTDADRVRLLDPGIGGVILFSRNYASLPQLRALTAEIHSMRAPSLLVAVDHEGGRVQRFREGFTPVPPMRTLGVMLGMAQRAVASGARVFEILDRGPELVAPQATQAL